MFNQLGMNAKYYEDASAVMVIYDVSNHDSLKSCGKWLEGVKAARKGSQGQSMSQPVQTPIIGALVGNKKDYRLDRMENDLSTSPIRDSRAEVLKDEAQRIGADLGLAFFEASAVILTPYYILFLHFDFSHLSLTRFSRNDNDFFPDEQ